MANTSRSLEMRIKAIVDGLSDIQALRNELVSLGTSATAAIKSAVSSATGLDAANKSLQGTAEAVGKVTQATEAASAKVDSLSKGFGVGFTTGALSLSTNLQNVASEAVKAASSMQTIDGSVTGASRSIVNFAQTSAAGSEGAVKLNNSLAAIVSNATLTAKAMANLPASTNTGANGFRDFGGAATAASLKTITLNGSLSEMGRTAAAASAGLRTIAPAAGSTAGFFDRLGVAVNNVGVAFQQGKGSVNSYEGAIKSIEGSGNELVGILKKAAGAFVALIAIKGLNDMTQYAARVETLGVTLNVVAKNAGYTTEQVHKFEESLKAQGITTESARESLTKMIQAGLDLNAVNKDGAGIAASLARASQDLAVVTGQNSSDTLNRLITNIQQLDSMGLRYMGLTVNIEAAQSKFATSIGKTADQLNQQQKIQAVANETLAEAAKLSGTYEAALDTVGKKLSSLDRYVKEATKSLGDELTPAFGVLVDAATAFLKNLDLVIKKTSETAGVGQVVKDSVAAVIGPLVELFTTVINSVAELAPTILLVGKQLGDIIATLFTFAGTMTGTAKDAGLFRVALESVGLVLALVQDGISFLGIGVQALGFNFLKLAEYALRAAAAAEGAFPKKEHQERAAALKQEADELARVSAFTKEMIENQVAAFAQGGSSLDKYTAALAKLKAEQDKAPDTVSKTRDAYTRLDEQIRLLTKSISEGKTTSTEGEVAIAKLRNTVKVFGDANLITTAQVKDLGKGLDTLASNNAARAAEALGKLGLTYVTIGKTQFLEKVNADFGVFSTNLREVATNAQLTGVEFQQAFSKGIDKTKTLADIASLVNVLNDAKLAGKDVGDSFAQVGQQFQIVFDQRLKTANSQQEFKQLRTEVIALRDTFPQLAAQATSDLAKIDSKLATLGVSSVEAAKQATEITQARVAAAKSALDVDKADIEIYKSRQSLTNAILALNKEDTELNRTKVALAQAQLNLSVAQRQQAVTRNQTDVQNLNVQIALQKQLNTEKAAGQGQASEAQVAAAQAYADQQQVILEGLKEQGSEQDLNVATQQVQVDKLQAAVQTQTELNAALKDGKTTQDQNTSSATSTGQVYQSLISTVAGLTEQFLQVGLSQSAATEKAKELFRTFQNGDVDIGNIWKGINYINKSVDDTIALNKQQLAQAEAIKNQYQAVKDGATGVYNANNLNVYALGRMTEGAKAVAAAYAQIRADAIQTVKSGMDAADSFISSNRSISEELLTAQGREKEVIDSKYAARKADLAVQYELLKVQLQIAIATAKAAKVDYSGLQASLAEAQSSYAKSVKDLAALEAIDQKKRADAALAAIQKEKDAKAKAAAQEIADKEKSNQRLLDLQKELYAEQGRQDAARAIERKRNLDGLTAQEQDLQRQIDALKDAKKAKADADARAQGQGNVTKPSAVNVTSPASQSASYSASQAGYTPASGYSSGSDISDIATKTIPASPIVKKIQVEIISNGKRVSATIDEGDEAALMAVLQNARKRSSTPS